MQTSQLPQGCAFLAEVVEQHLAAAARRFAVGEQRGQPLRFEDFLAFAGAGFGDARVLQRDVLHAVGHPGFGRFAVAPGAAGFLVVGLDALGQVEVGDETDIGLVDAHAEGDGGAHDQAFLAQEAALVGGAFGSGQAGVVGQGGIALGRQPFGGFLDLLARQAIDDAGLALAAGQEAEQLLPGVVLFDDGVADVRAVEAGEEDAGFAQAEANAGFRCASPGRRWRSARCAARPG